jgi:lysozyme
VNYELSKEGLAEIIAYEAIILTPYLDSVGVKTVGIGSTKSDIPDLASWPWDRKVTVDEAVRMFRAHVVKYAQSVNKALKQEVTQYQFDALVSITYNIGTGGMAKSTFMKLVNAQAPASMVGKAFKSWNKGGGRVIQGLVNRRAKEAKLFETGRYSSDMKALLVPVRPNHKPNYSAARTIDLREYL